MCRAGQPLQRVCFRALKLWTSCAQLQHESKGECFGPALSFLRNIALLAPAAPVGSVQEVISIAQGAFCILINRDDDCLDMVVTPAFARS
jgi:hypothetical protein